MSFTRGGAERDQDHAGGGEHPVHLCLASMFYHPVYAGGAERFRRYLPGLRERGLEVSVFSGTPDPRRAAGSGIDKDWASSPPGTHLPLEFVDGIPVQRIRLPDEGAVRRGAAFARGVEVYCRGRTHSPDIVQVLTPHFATLATVWRLRRAGLPTVSTGTMMPLLPRNPLKRQLLRALIRVPSEMVDCEVVGSREMLKAFRALGIRNRIEVIPHGVDIGRFRPAASSGEQRTIRRALGVPERATILLFVGSTEPRKGAHRLLDAWRHIASQRPDVHLVMVGPTRNDGFPARISSNDALKPWANLSEARDRLHTPGTVSNVEEYMRAADIFVFPSSREGVPNVVGEAMASGVPVVLCPFIGLSQDFGQPDHEYVLSGFDPLQLATDICALLDAPHRRVELGLNARAWAEAHLDVSRSLDRYASLYSELVAAHRRRAL